MKFLNKEEENLLWERLERSDDFPAILAEKLERASKTEMIIRKISIIQAMKTD